MLSFVYLNEADLGPLATAAESWAALPAKYHGLQDELDRRVVNQLKGHWRGEAADAALAAMRKARTQYQDAATEAGRIARLLKDAHGEFAACQRRLHSLVEESRSDGFRVSDKGVIEDVDPRWDSSDHATDQEFAEQRKQRLEAFASRMTEILELATVADEAAAAALERDANAGSDAFNTRVYTSLDAVEIDQATALARKGEELTDAELDRLNRLLEANRKDSGFTTGFYAELGPRKVLDFYANLTAQAGESPDSRRFAEVQELQQNLGHSLATATDPDNEPHLSEQWNGELRSLGAQQFTLGDNPGYPYRPYGYQILGGILRYGSYDADFLTPIARHAVSLEAGDPGIWAENAPRGALNDHITSNPSGAGGDGFDPMTGILEGLGHSPEAAEDFFTGDVVAYHTDGTVDPDGTVTSDRGDDGQEVGSYLDYFTDTERNWLHDTAEFRPEAAAGAARHGPDALGHALEAATSGVPYDYDGTDLPRHSPAQAALVSDIVDKFGGEGGGELINGADGAPLESMRDSLGHIAAHYMGDMQNAVSSYQDLPVHGSSADLDAAAARAFLGEVGQDPDAYRAISAAQQAYTAALVDEAMNGESLSVTTETRVENAVHPGARMAGIMTEARAEAVWDTKRAEDEEFNQNAEDIGTWVGRGAGLATGAVRTPVVGDVAGWMIEEVQDSVLESIEQDSTSEAEYQAGQTYTNGEQQAERFSRSAVQQSGERGEFDQETLKVLRQAAARQAQVSFSSGSQAEDVRNG